MERRSVPHPARVFYVAYKSGAQVILSVKGFVVEYTDFIEITPISSYIDCIMKKDSSLYTLYIPKNNVILIEFKREFRQEDTLFMDMVGKMCTPDSIKSMLRDLVNEMQATQDITDEEIEMIDSSDRKRIIPLNTDNTDEMLYIAKILSESKITAMTKKNGMLYIKLQWGEKYVFMVHNEEKDMLVLYEEVL